MDKNVAMHSTATRQVILKLYISGMTSAARRAIENIEKICANLSPLMTYNIEVIDISENPEAAESAKIVATPTVVRQLPHPIRRLIGDLSDKEQVLVGLELVDYEV